MLKMKRETWLKLRLVILIWKLRKRILPEEQVLRPAITVKTPAQSGKHAIGHVKHGSNLNR